VKFALVELVLSKGVCFILEQKLRTLDCSISCLETTLNAMQVIRVTRQATEKVKDLRYPGILETIYTWLETSVSKPDPDPDPYWECRSGSNSNKFGLPCQRLAATPSKGNNNVLILHSST
jgi:hypothetical protein